jgi:hypothetical protein
VAELVVGPVEPDVLGHQPVFELGASGTPIPGGALRLSGFDQIFKVAPGCDT